MSHNFPLVIIFCPVIIVVVLAKIITLHGLKLCYNTYYKEGFPLYWAFNERKVP
jgi:hypothetical protein